MSEPKVYDSKDIFEDIPGDSENVTMKIPPEVYEKMGWKEGDVLKVKIEGETITITKHE